MPLRLVVNLKPEARADLASVAGRLSDQLDMRVGLSFPRQGLLVGEVRGQVELDRIATMAEIGAVRVQASAAGLKTPRASRSRAAKTRA